MYTGESRIDGFEGMRVDEIIKGVILDEQKRRDP